MSRIEDLIKEEMTPKTIRHWGTEIHDHVPILIDQVHGDGQCLIAIVPLNTRPDYYIMRIDSSCSQIIKDDGDDMTDLLDQELYDAIEDQCGPRYWEDDDENLHDESFPALDLECGCVWEEIT